MNLKTPAIVAALLCCMSCMESSYRLGQSLNPIDQQYDIYTVEIPIDEIVMKMADSLSGYSSNRITIGSVKDKTFGTITKGSALTLVPAFMDTLDLGRPGTRKATRFHFAAGYDTTNFVNENQRNILQKVHVYPLNAGVRNQNISDCNAVIPYGNFAGFNGRISKADPIINGTDSLSFDFTQEFGQYFLDKFDQIDKDTDFDDFISKFPGIYLTTDAATTEGRGRINCLKLQLNYNSSYYYIEGNCAVLNFSADFKNSDGVWEKKDTSCCFFYGLDKFYDLDSLLTNSGTGSFPQYALNVTGYEDRTGKKQVDVSNEETFSIEGGGGYKPVISAKYLRKKVMDEVRKNISAKNLNPADTSEAIINKASIVLPFEFPDDYGTMFRYPTILSPVCKVKDDDGNVIFGNLTDYSNDEANQGDIDRSNLEYAPDITYHLQEILNLTKWDKLTNYDIWMLIMANEVTETTTTTSSDMSEYYKYLAYQSYYSSMYSGYGGYGGYGSGYGYGSYGNSYYSNYYSYMLASMYANSGTSETTEKSLDRDRYYCGVFHAPKWSDSSKRPVLKITYSLPKE